MSIRTSLAWSYGAHLLVFAVTFGSTIIMSRLLTPRDLGVFGVGMAISGILTTFSYFGVTNYLIRDRDLSDETIATSFTINGILCLIVGSLLLLAGTVGHSLFLDPAIPRVMQWLSLVPLIGIAEFLPATLLTRDMRFSVTSTIQFGKALANAAVMTVAALFGWSYLSPALGAIAGAIFGAIGYSLLGRSHVSFRLSFKGGWAIVVFAVQMISGGGVAVLAARFAELLVAQQLGLIALGLYTRASGLAAMVWDGAYGLSTRVIYVQMATELREQGSLKATFLRATKLLTAIMWPIMAGIAVLAGPIIHLLYGARWDGAALPLSLLMVGQFIAIGYGMSWELCVLTGRTGWQARTELLRAVVGLAAFAVGVLFNLSAAAAARIIEAVLGYLVYRPKMADMAGAPPAEVSAAYNGNLFLAACAVGPAFLLMSLSRWSPATSITEVTFAIVVGVAGWIAMLHLIRHPLLDEAHQLLGGQTVQRSPNKD